MWTPAEAIAGLESIGRQPVPDGAPTVAADTIDWLVHGDPRPALGIEA
jgi:hypothetical protein